MSLFSEDDETVSAKRFDAFMEKLKDETPDITGALNCLIRSYNHFCTQQDQAGITDQSPGLNFAKLYSIKSWANNGVKKQRENSPQKEFEMILMENDSPGEVLHSLKRTLKLLEYLESARENDKTGHFPKYLKHWSETSIDAFRRSFLVQTPETKK